MRNSGFSSFSTKNSMWSSTHWSLDDTPCWHVGRNVCTHSTVSRSALCHGVMARGQVLSVLSWIHCAIRDMHVEGGFLLFDVFLGLVRWGRMGGGEEKVSFLWRLGGLYSGVGGHL